MPSSKFNRLPTPRLRPAICFPPPGSCRKSYVVNQPEWIVGRYKWKDWHPPNPIDRYGLMDLQWEPANVRYYGCLDHGRGWVSMTLTHDPLDMVYRLDLRCHIQPDQYLIHSWFDIPHHSLGHIDTGNLTMVNEVGIDYREARAVG